MSDYNQKKDILRTYFSCLKKSEFVNIWSFDKSQANKDLKDIKMKKQKPILINDQNKSLLQEKLDEIHSARQINHLMDMEDLFKQVERLEKYTSSLLKKHKKYLMYCYSKNQSKASSYNYSYQADVAYLCWTKDGWALESVERKNFYPTTKNISCLRFSTPLNEQGEEMQKEIKEFIFNQFLEF